MSTITLFPAIVYLSTIFGFLTLVFLLALYKKDNSIMDIVYGPTYLLSGIALLLSYNYAYTPLMFILIGCVLLWSTRLSVRIFRKNYGKPEDKRYQKWREEWNQKGRWYFIVRSYLQIYLLQGTIITLVGLPLLLAFSVNGEPLLPVVLLGAFVFATGLAYETIADLQLDKFIRRKINGDTDQNVMTEGLFRYSRRPNYFGESMIWVGMAIMTVTLPWGVIGLISPILITYIVTRVTGPMLEKIFIQQYPEEYGEYQKNTNYFIPWFPKN